MQTLAKRLRIAATTVAAVASGLFTMATGGGVRTPIVLASGDVAPDFELTGSDGRTHRLSDSRGREAVVVAWFPKAFTGGCTAECESIGRSRARLRSVQAKVFGATLDSPEINRRFAASMGVDFAILSDPDGTVRARVRRPWGERVSAPMDVLHRGGRTDSGDRQARALPVAWRGGFRAAGTTGYPTAARCAADHKLTDAVRLECCNDAARQVPRATARQASRRPRAPRLRRGNSARTSATRSPPLRERMKIRACGRPPSRS